jgi:HlyD family secretion protein
MQAHCADAAVIKVAQPWRHCDAGTVPAAMAPELAQASGASPVLDKRSAVPEELREMWLNSHGPREQLTQEVQVGASAPKEVVPPYCANFFWSCAPPPCDWGCPFRQDPRRAGFFLCKVPSTDVLVLPLSRHRWFRSMFRRPISMKTSRWKWLGLAAFVLLALMMVWRGLRGSEVDAVEARIAPLVRTIQFSARVTAMSRVDVGSTLTGRVAQVLVREGELVRQGDPLVKLESAELQAALDQAVASEQQSRARVQGLRTSGRFSVQAAVAQAEAGVTASRADMERVQQLVAQGFLSASRLDEARRALDVALALQSSARAQSQANADSGTDMAQAEAQSAAARAVVIAARAKLEQTVLRAPANGRVLSRDVELGQIVQPGRALMGLAIEGPTLLKAQVDERFLEQLQNGQKAMVVADAFVGSRFAAHVQSIAPAVDAQRGAVEVKLVLEQEPPVFLREDMTLSVEVETGRQERALALPLAALRGPVSPAGALVLVLENGKAQQRSLRLGLRTLEAVEVQRGLAEGDVVLLGGAIQAGDRVRTRLLATWPRIGTAQGDNGGGAGAAMTNAMGR